MERKSLVSPASSWMSVADDQLLYEMFSAKAGRSEDEEMLARIFLQSKLQHVAADTSRKRSAESMLLVLQTFSILASVQQNSVADYIMC